MTLLKDQMQSRKAFSSFMVLVTDFFLPTKLIEQAEGLSGID